MRGEGGGDVTRSLQCSVLAVKVPGAQFFQAKPWGTGLLCDPHLPADPAPPACVDSIAKLSELGLM